MKKINSIADLKQAMKEPASKEWFAKYGLPKGLSPKKKMAKKMK